MDGRAARGGEPLPATGLRTALNEAHPVLPEHDPAMLVEAARAGVPRLIVIG
jgi:hypothetical protein